MNPKPNRWQRFRRWSRGKRLYATAFVAALPDILTGLQVVDFSQALPPGVSSKLAIAIVILRLVITSTSTRAALLRTKPEKEPDLKRGSGPSQSGAQ